MAKVGGHKQLHSIFSTLARTVSPQQYVARKPQKMRCLAFMKLMQPVAISPVPARLLPRCIKVNGVPKMKKGFALILATTSAAAMSAPALAQDNEAFTGPRVEGLIGYDISKAGSDIDDDLADDESQSIDGFMYGVGVGYDFAMGGAVLGVEGEVTSSTAETQFVDGDLEDIGFGAELETGRDIYLGVRAGALVNPNVLVYAKGGYTNARYNLLADDGANAIEADLDLDGWRAGAGVEYATSERSFVKLEYRYSNYGEGEFDFEDNDFFDDDVGESDRFDADLDRHQVVLGAGFRF